MKQMLGVRVSAHSQANPCVYECTDSTLACSVGNAVMIETENGLSFGRVVWMRIFGSREEAEVILENLPHDAQYPCASTGVPLEEIIPRAQQEQASKEGDIPSSSCAGKNCYCTPGLGDSLPSFDQIPRVRIPTKDEEVLGVEAEQIAREGFLFCRQCVKERELDMKLVDVEALYDKSKLIFYFTAPTRIDFRELVKDLVRRFRTRIELRQIGVRHETQMVGAVGNCGQVVCCRRYLRKFAPVTIKMAKEQNLFLNPAKISGICGRLLCCLSYEQHNYDAFNHSCPKLGKRYQTDEGPLRVLRANMFRNSIMVLPEEGPEKELTLEEWEALHPNRPESVPHQNGNNPVVHTQPSYMVLSAHPDTLDADLAEWPDE